MNELTTKRFRLVMMDGSTILLDENETHAVKSAIIRGDKYLEIGDSLILTTHVLKVIGDESYQEVKRIRRGDYKCPDCGRWVPAKMTCAHRD
jgi:hypothetical protein